MTPEEKETAIRFARILCKTHGWRMVVSGTGNDRRLKFFGPHGAQVSVWYPVEPRVNDCEMKDLDEILKHITEE